MAFRSARDNASDSDDSESSGSFSTRRNSASESSPGGVMGAEATLAAVEGQYGPEAYPKTLRKTLLRKAKKYGTDRVSQWAEEGIPAETLGKARSMDEFRERQAERPPDVPTDIEQHNEASVYRSRKAQYETDPSGDAGVPSSVREVISSPGKNLDGEVRSDLEDRLGTSLDHVQVHTGPRAQQACEAIDARAFTVGNHIAFGPGEYDPSSPEGQHLIAHEVVHTLQQPDAAMSMMPKADLDVEIDPDPKAEREADEIAGEVMKGGDVGMRKSWQTAVHVQRHHKDQIRWDNGKLGPLKPEVAEKRTTREDKPYGYDSRPNYASGQRAVVWNRAKDEDGLVFCEVDGVLLDRDNWCMGHKPRREYRFLVEYYLRGIITRDEFLAEYRNPDHYQPESHHASSSGKHEENGQYWQEKWGPLE